MIINSAVLAGIAQSFSTIFNAAFDTAPSEWELVAMQVPSTGASEAYPWLGDLPQMREWIGDRVIKDLAAHKYEIVNKAFESTIGVDRDDIEDDRIGLYTPKIQAMADAAKKHPDVLVFALLKAGFATVCSDGQYFFDSDHSVAGASVSNTGGGSGEPWFLVDLSRPIKPLILQRRRDVEFNALDDPNTNERAFMRKEYLYGVNDRKNVGFGLWQLAYGSKDTLNATNYATGRAAMMSWTNDRGEPLGIRPTHLLAGPTHESAGRKLLKSQLSTAGETNEWYDTAELVITPWLA